MKYRISRFAYLWLFAVIVLNACSKAVEDVNSDAVKEKARTQVLEYSINVSVTNMVGSGLIIQNNGGDDLSITENKTYQFTKSLLDGEAFDISVLESPTSPNQVCNFDPQNGVIDKLDVLVNLNCVTEQYTIGGNVAGLSGSGLALQLNGDSDVTINPDAQNIVEFVFLQTLDDGSSFQVTLLSQPTNPTQYCQLSNNSGSLNGGAVDNIQVQCLDEATVVRRYPPDLAQRAPRDSAIIARLSQAIDEATLSDTVFSLSAANGDVSGAVTYDANTYTLTLTPAAPLDYGAQYTVNLGNGLRDSNNNPISDSWSFRATNSQFTKLLASSISTAADDTMFSADDYLRVQMLYSADVLSSTSGYIHGLSFSYATELTSEVTCFGTTVKIGHSNVSELNSSFVTNINQGQGSPETVLNNVDIVIPTGTAGEYFRLLFDEAFYFNGVDNLVVELQRGQCSANVDVVLQNESIAKRLLSTFTGLTGNLTQDLPHTKLLFTGGENTINYPLAANPAYAPFAANSYAWRVLALYPATDINGAGWINGVAFKLAQDVTTDQNYTFAVKMAHTNRASLDPEVVDSNYAATPESITDTVTIDIPASSTAGQYLWVPFTKRFLYDGESNLIVEIVVSSAVGDMPLELGVSGAGNNMRLRGQASTRWAEGANQDSFNIAIRFADSNMDVIPSGYNETADYPFNGTSDSIMQLLYDKTELGSSGAIKKLGFRMSTAANVELYKNVEVVMAHTSNIELTGVFAENILDPISVFRGDVVFGDNLSSGDWVEIELDTPFLYDATQNLVIQIKSDAGVNENDNYLALEYSNRLNKRVNFAYSRDAITASGLYPTSKMPIKIGM